MEKIGITGYRGEVGRYLLSTYDSFVGLDCDVTKPAEIENCVRDSGIKFILHLAAKSDVEFCEKPENARIVSDVNLRGSFNVCEVAQRLGMDVVLLSSDHIFNGRWGNYKENSGPQPINNYGLSKFAAEGAQVVFDNLKIIRTSYLFDAYRLHQDIENLSLGKLAEYPTFIKRSFMYLPHFCSLLYAYFNNDYRSMPKVLHISGNKIVSWYDFMSKICDIYRFKTYPVPKRWETKGLAPRPHNGGLNVSLSKKLGFTQSSYIDGIRQMYEDSEL